MTRIRCAIQKSGRLSEDSIELMKECGIAFESNRGTSKLRSQASNFPIEFIFLRDDDIAGYVKDGVVDCGIIGENCLVEQFGEGTSLIRLVERLGFSKCRLSLAVPRAMQYESLSDLTGKRIATSHPAILGAFLKKSGLSAQIHEISGSVEIAPSMGLAEAICDLVGSGSTLVSNGLKEVEVVFNSEAVLIAGSNLVQDKLTLLDKLLFRISAVRRAKHNKYVLLNAPNKSLDRIVEILPGIKSPTIVPLADSEWSSVHSVMHEDEFWEKIENLQEAGAQGILIIPIEKMVV